jgi:hypothetical protein
VPSPVAATGAGAPAAGDRARGTDAPQPRAAGARVAGARRLARAPTAPPATVAGRTPATADAIVGRGTTSDGTTAAASGARRADRAAPRGADGVSPEPTGAAPTARPASVTSGRRGRRVGGVGVRSRRPRVAGRRGAGWPAGPPGRAAARLRRSP